MPWIMFGCFYSYLNQFYLSTELDFLYAGSCDCVLRRLLLFCYDMIVSLLEFIGRCLIEMRIYIGFQTVLIICYCVFEHFC